MRWVGKRKLPAEVDVEHYLRGEVPTQAALEWAARIDNWELLVDLDGDKGPAMLISGFAFACSEVQDGEAIETSEIVWLDRKFRFVRTWSTLYRLGDRVIPIDGVTL
jgi:hypothetical protein